MHLQGRSLGDVSLTPLRKLLRRKCQMAVAAAGRIYEYALVSDTNGYPKTLDKILWPENAR